MPSQHPVRVILHCAATPDYPPENSAFDLFGRADIDVWHRQKGWDGIGYHWVIRRSGVLEAGRDPLVVGAHTHGHNTGSLGICLIGTRWFMQRQWEQLQKLYLDIEATYGIEWSQWYGHNEFTSQKTCPGVPMNLVREMLRWFHEAKLFHVEQPA